VAAFCGIDVGTQGSKAGIYVDDGTCVGTGYAEHTFHHLRPGWVEMDPEQIVGASVAAVAAAVREAAAAGVAAGDIAAIALSGILCGPVFVDEHWVPVRPLIPFLDVRAADEVAWLSSEVEPRWVAESANASLDTYVMPAVWEWVRRHEPDVSARIDKILSLAPYVGGRLAGLSGSSAYTDASHLSGWIIGWDAATGTPSPRQLADLGIPAEQAPTVRAPWDVVGGLTADMADRTGLSPGTPICAGAGDVMQSNLGAGLVRPGMASDVAGTASILTVGVAGPSPAITAVPGMLYSCATLPGQGLYWGYVKAGGLSLRWFRDGVLGRDGDDAVYAEGDRLAANVAPGADGVLFTPYLSGGNPDNPDAAGTFLGMTAATSRATLWRSMLEAIAFEYADFLEVFAANGIAVSDVRAVGGGARSTLWNQIKADVVGVPWRVPARQDGAVLADAAVAAVAVAGGAGPALAGTVTAWLDAGGSPPAAVVDRVAHSRYASIRAVRRSLLTGPLREAFGILAPLREGSTP
jgi:xylulokinase